MLKKARQLIGSGNDTLKGQLSLEGHRGRSCAGVTIRVAQRIVARRTDTPPDRRPSAGAC